MILLKIFGKYSKSMVILEILNFFWKFRKNWNFFENFGKKLKILEKKIENFGKKLEILEKKFQSRRQILTARGVYLLKSFFVRSLNYLHFVKIRKFDDKKKRRISLFLFFWQFFPSTILPTSDDILTFNILLLLFLMERRKPTTKSSTGTMLLQHHKQCRRLDLIITLPYFGPPWAS